MLRRFFRIFDDRPGHVRGKVVGLFLFLGLANVMVWLLAYSTFAGFPLLMGTALLAYGLGLRHAVDADHIAAIDNVTRKLMQEGKQPVAVGMFFSFGHSTVVVLASVAIAITATAIQKHFPEFQTVGGVVGTAVSAIFLWVIALINVVVFWDIYKTFRDVSAGGAYNAQSLHDLLGQRGLLGRFFRPLFRLIKQSWHMYPLGFLFGLGFDTATEIGLLGISANQAAKGLSIWSILLFPALFTVGMSLIDALDGVLMLGAYGWAYIKPLRKLYYNMIITFVSVLVALFVGTAEAFGLISAKLDLRGGLWDYFGGLSDGMGGMGYVIIGIFALSWIVSTAIYKARKYDEIEVAED